MKEKLNNQQIILISLIVNCLLLILNIITYGIDGVGLGRIIVITLTNSLLITSLMTSLRNPVVTLLLVTASSTSAVVDELLQGKGLGDSIENVGYTFILGIVVTLAYIIYIYSKKTIKGDKIVTRLKNVITYEREPLKIPIWCTFIIWCMYLTVLFNTSNSGDFIEYRDTEFRIYASAVIISPTFIYLAMCTTSVLIYQFYSLYTVLKVYTMYKLYITHSIDWQYILGTLLEISVFTLVIIIYNKNNKRTCKQKKVERTCKQKKVCKQKKASKNKKKK